MCMYTSLVERTPAVGRHAHFSAGVASANASSCLVTCFNSPPKPCPTPSEIVWATADVQRQNITSIRFFTVPPISRNSRTIVPVGDERAFEGQQNRSKRPGKYLPHSR